MNRIKLVFILLFFCPSVYAQFATVDVAANVQIQANNTISRIISGLTKIQASVNNDALLEAVKTSSTVTKQFALVDQIYSIASGMGSLKKVKDLFAKTSITSNEIMMLSSYLANNRAKGLSSSDKEIVKNGIDLSIDELKVAMETIQFALSPVNKLSVSERLKEFNNAVQNLNNATSFLDQGKSIVYKAAIVSEKTDKRDYYLNYKYGIK